ncbi:unnamed protein product [Lymnaea stagnalis]|uniref:Protein kinase domain-containing protein n=1 Tax=Lymnaea stagnalis TaxID=6523 RepID=A0AAV2H7K7_LYMST
MLPAKRAKLDMEDDGERLRLLEDELQVIQAEVEPIEVKRSSTSRTESVTYRPTYRAVLAKNGYLVRKTLGNGSYSKVKLAISLNKSKSLVAVKIVDRNKAPKDFQTKFLPRELDIWPGLRHPNIIKVLDAFDDGRRVYMILEYAENGDVLRYIQKVGALVENLAKGWTWQLCDAVRYLHDLNITHRDLKLENLLLDKSFNIKLCDFGFVKGDCTLSMSQTYCGSKSYAAPEILKGEPYDPKKADMWAIGVILYIFVTGKMPFDESRGNSGVLEEQKKLEFPWQKYKRVTSEEKSLVLKLFTHDFQMRPDIHRVMRNRWMDSAQQIEAKLGDLANEGKNNHHSHHYHHHHHHHHHHRHHSRDKGGDKPIAEKQNTTTANPMPAQ